MGSIFSSNAFWAHRAAPLTSYSKIVFFKFFKTSALIISSIQQDNDLIDYTQLKARIDNYLHLILLFTL